MKKELEKPTYVPAIRESAYEIWLAGLGALSLAEDESGKLFRALVKRGKAYEKNAKKQVDDLKVKLDVKKAAADTIARIGDSVDDGVTDVLHRLGLPTKKEIDGLTKRVERLTKALETAPPKASRRRTAKPAVEEAASI